MTETRRERWGITDPDYFLTDRQAAFFPLPTRTHVEKTNIDPVDNFLIYQYFAFYLLLL
jgi:hypothetical protein